MKIAIVLSRDEINALQFPIVVEGMINGLNGRKRRKFFEEFTMAEYQKARYWYKHFYRWYLVKGTPEHHVFRPDTLEFIYRLTNFFGGY